MVSNDQVHVAVFLDAGCGTIDAGGQKVPAQDPGSPGSPGCPPSRLPSIHRLLGLLADEGWQATLFDRPEAIVNGVQSGQFHLAVVVATGFQPVTGSTGFQPVASDPGWKPGPPRAAFPDSAMHTLMGLQVDTPVMVLVADPQDARRLPALAEATRDQVLGLDCDPAAAMELFRREVRSAVLSQPDYVIVCVDDDREFLASLEEFLPARLARAFPRFTLSFDFYDSPVAALDAVTRISQSKEALAIVVSDQIMPTMPGIELLARVKDVSPTTLRVLLTGQAGLPVAVEGINNQILDKFLTKPIEEPTGFVNTLKHLIQEHHLRLRGEWHRRRVMAQFNFIRTISSSRNVEEAVEAAVRFVHVHTRSRRIVALLRDAGETDGFTVQADTDVSRGSTGFQPVAGHTGWKPVPTRLSPTTPLVDWMIANHSTLSAASAAGLPTPLDPGQPLAALVGFPLMVVPLVWSETMLGMLLVTGSSPGGYTRDDQLMIDFAADIVAVAIGGLQDRQALEHHYVATMSSLMEAVEAKDRYTAGHTSRVTHYALELAQALGISGRPLKDIEFAAALHDIGKIAVPDQIITKPGKLTDAEFEKMKQHPDTGDRMLRHLRFLRTARMILRAHHERYDGTGYQDRLTAEEIPLGGRILAIADAFDAMTSDRSYRNAMSPEQALREIEAKAGTQFDPRLAAIFTKLMRTQHVGGTGFRPVPTTGALGSEQDDPTTIGGQA